MSLLELFILAVGLSMDAFAVAVCKGLSMREVSINKAGIVGLYFGGFQAGMSLIGYFLGLQFKDYIMSVDHWIAFILLSFLGIKMIQEALSKIFTPINISIIPPTNSALDLYFIPNTLPILTPIIDKTNVIIPIKDTAML